MTKQQKNTAKKGSFDFLRAMWRVHIQPQTYAAVTNRGSAGLLWTSKENAYRNNFTFGNVNTGISRGRANELAETLYCRLVSISCCQKIRRKVEGWGYIEGKTERSKAFWTSADNQGFDGVAILIEKQKQDVLYVRRISHRIIPLRMKQDNFDNLYQLMNTIVMIFQYRRSQM